MPKKIYRNKKALSEVVAVVIVILLVLASGAVVWSVVNNLIEKRTEQISSCFDADFSESIVFNNDYTCYNSSSNEVQFSLEVKDIDIEKAIVSISFEGGSKTFTLTNGLQTISGLYTYPYKEASVALPERNGGKTYIATGVSSTPDWIKIVPYVNDKQCEVSDTVYSLYDCSDFS